MKPTSNHCPVLEGPADTPCIRAATWRPDIAGYCCNKHYADIEHLVTAYQNRQTDALPL
jgi:hypothetical protein